MILPPGAVSLQRVLTDRINTLIEEWEAVPVWERATRPGLAYFIARQLLQAGIVGED